MADGWLKPGTCGVRAAEFDELAHQMRRAAPALEDLAHELWSALRAAGASTQPALEIRRIAEWTRDKSTDLQRRNLLVHDLDRQNLAFSFCTRTGTYMVLPDRYTHQTANADGLRTAMLFRLTQAGDKKALTRLRRIDPAVIDPYFAHGLLTGLGPDTLTTLPITLIQQLKAGTDQPTASDTRAVLALLGRALAIGTDEASPAYAGDDYLAKLATAGRTTLKPQGTAGPRGITGYQSLSTLLAAADSPRLSMSFVQLVGSDMIQYEHDIHPHLHGRPLPTLTEEFHLDPTTLTPTATPTHTDFLLPLLAATARTGREASQALLLRQDPGIPSNLRYLLQTRRPLWSQTDHAATLGHLLKTATTGPDPTSQNLTFQTGTLLADDARNLFVPDNEKLTIPDKSTLDALSALRPHLAEVFAHHISKINAIYADINPKGASSTAMNSADLDYLWLEIARDSKAFETLLQAQIAHARVNIEHGVISDASLQDIICREANVLGHIIEARNQAIQAETNRVESVNTHLMQMIESGVGLIDYTGTARFGPAGLKAQELLIGSTRKQLVSWLVNHHAEKPDPATVAPRSDTEAAERLLNYIILSSRIRHGNYRYEGLAGKSFVLPGTTTIRPLNSLSDHEFEIFSMWVADQLNDSELRDTLQTATFNGAFEAAGHYEDPSGRNIPPTLQR